MGYLEKYNIRVLHREVGETRAWQRYKRKWMYCNDSDTVEVRPGKKYDVARCYYSRIKDMKDKNKRSSNKRKWCESRNWSNHVKLLGEEIVFGTRRMDMAIPKHQGALHHPVQKIYMWRLSRQNQRVGGIVQDEGSVL